MQVQSNLRLDDWEIEKSCSQKYCLSLLCGNCDRAVQSILIRAGSKFKIHSHLEHPIGGPQKPVEHHGKTDESIFFFIFETSVCLLNTLFLEAEHWSVTLRRQERIMFDCVSRCLFVGCYQCLSVIWGRPGWSEEALSSTHSLFVLHFLSEAENLSRSEVVRVPNPLACTFWVRRRTCPGRRRLLADPSRSSTTCPTSSLQPPVNKWKSSSEKHPF